MSCAIQGCRIDSRGHTNKPVRCGIGGGLDTLARQISADLQRAWCQSVTEEDAPSSSENIGGQEVLG